MSNSKYGHISDEELLKRFYSDHDNKWLGVLMERYTLALLGVCMKYLKNEQEAQDMVQKVFLTAFKELHKYQVKSFKSWVYMIAKNYCLMDFRYKKGKPKAVVITEDTLSTFAEAESNQHLVEKEQTLDKLAAALLQLNNEQQLCVTLFYMEKKSYQEIADLSNLSVLQVKSHIQNGRRNLKVIMNKMREDEEE